MVCLYVRSAQQKANPLRAKQAAETTTDEQQIKSANRMFRRKGENEHKPSALIYQHHWLIHF